MAEIDSDISTVDERDVAQVETKIHDFFQNKRQLSFRTALVDAVPLSNDAPTSCQSEKCEPQGHPQTLNSVKIMRT